MRPLLIFIGTIMLLQSCGRKAEKMSMPTGEKAIPVKLQPIGIDSGERIIHASGLLGTEDEARLSFKTAGIIGAVLVKEGQRVKKGQLLATLRSAEISAQVQQVRLTLEKAQRDYQRAGNLYKDSVATLEQLQNAKTGVDIARQNLQQVSFNEEYASIHAPSDGFIVKKNASAGEQASAGTPVLIMNAVSPSSKWILMAGVPDKDWAMIGTGNKALVSFDAFPGKNFPAVVSKRALAADPGSGSFQVELQVKFSGEQPATGMFGTVAIHPSKRLSGTVIPYEALLEANGKQGFVFVCDDRKTVRRIPVTIGSIKENIVVVSGGLDGHSFVVTAGSPYLTDSSTVTVTP